MDDVNGNGEVWTRIELDPGQGRPELDREQEEQINDHPLLASEGTREVEMLRAGRCLCGMGLGEETVIISNSGGNLAVMCSSQCLDDHMALGFLGNLIEAIGKGVHQRKVQSDVELGGSEG